jgi:hypothetical protein
MEIATNKEWCKKVQAIRKAIKELHIRDVLVTPRATLDGEKLLAGGMDMETVLRIRVWKGLKQSDIEKIKGRI